MESLDCVVIGAGVVGLAIARELALRGREVLILESEPGIGTGISSRNSEVIHAGIYYPPHSLKAKLCVKGKELLYSYCRDRHIPNRACGKLLVATNAAQATHLNAIQANARMNGVLDLLYLHQSEIATIEPALQAQAALLSPSTGIIDSHALMLALQADLENLGGQLVFNTPLISADYLGRSAAATGTATHWRLHTPDMELESQILINAAGLSACTLAQQFRGLDSGFIPKPYWAKGNYFSLAAKPPFKHLIYPVPDPSSHLAGLGVHLTLDLGGQAKFGPDVEWIDSPQQVGAWEVTTARQSQFELAIRQYWPDLPTAALQANYVGIRPKISGPGQAAADFVLQGPTSHHLHGLMNLFGIESPGLTSCMAIAEEVADLILTPEHRI
jgi:L-2-hydroxyglutarate oxidase LhgO